AAGRRGPDPQARSHGQCFPVATSSCFVGLRATIMQGHRRVGPPPLTSSPRASKLASMEVNFTPHTEAQLKEFAARKGKDAAQVVEDTVSNMLERQARFVEGVQRGTASADRGDLIDHEEVVSRIDRLFEP